jgi:hydrogenase maturation protease
MKRVLVIGIGSLVMRDDGIGSRIVEALENSLRENDISSFVGETDFQCCYYEIKPDDLVIIIDAMVQGETPGSMDIMLLSDALKNRGKLRTQHEFSLFDLIELHAPQTRGYFIGIEAAEIGFGFELSAPLKKCFEQICTNVLSTVINIKEEAKHPCCKSHL